MTPPSAVLKRSDWRLGSIWDVFWSAAWREVHAQATCGAVIADLLRWHCPSPQPHHRRSSRPRRLGNLFEPSARSSAPNCFRPLRRRLGRRPDVARLRAGRRRHRFAALRVSRDGARIRRRLRAHPRAQSLCIGPTRAEGSPIRSTAGTTAEASTSTIRTVTFSRSSRAPTAVLGRKRPDHTRSSRRPFRSEKKVENTRAHATRLAACSPSTNTHAARTPVGLFLRKAPRGVLRQGAFFPRG